MNEKIEEMALRLFESHHPGRKSWLNLPEKFKDEWRARAYSEAKKTISKRAAKMLARIEAGEFYRCFRDEGPTIDELAVAGLISSAMRPVLFERCYVPAVGYKSYQPEEFPEPISFTLAVSLIRG